MESIKITQAEGIWKILNLDRDLQAFEGLLYGTDGRFRAQLESKVTDLPISVRMEIHWLKGLKRNCGLAKPKH